MEKMGVIANISTPTEWCNNLVVTEKSNGDIRLCLDPRSLNSAINVHPTHSKDLMTSNISLIILSISLNWT
jgi:hypothetical protein